MGVRTTGEGQRCGGRGNVKTGIFIVYLASLYEGDGSEVPGQFVLEGGPFCPEEPCHTEREGVDEGILLYKRPPNMQEMGEGS